MLVAHDFNSIALVSVVFCYFGEERTETFKKIVGLSRDRVDGKICLYVFWGHPFWRREKAHKQNPQKIPGQSREKLVYVFSLRLFFFAHSYIIPLSSHWCEGILYRGGLLRIALLYVPLTLDVCASGVGAAKDLTP